MIAEIFVLVRGENERSFYFIFLKSSIIKIWF